MSNREVVEYHSKRALAELNLGLIATTLQASRAHLQLASLHRQRMQALSEPGSLHEPMLSM